MRELWILNTIHELTDEKAETLLESGAVYESGENHDLHLTPDHSFTLSEVELLMSPD